MGGPKIMANEIILYKDDIIIINNITYRIITLIGHGKGGYSYLASYGNNEVVIKKIHHEPCSYYNFGDKIRSELNDYNTLLNLGIRIPKMIDYDLNKKIIIKEYIKGDVVSDLIKKKKDISKYIAQLREFLPILYNSNINIDYYPTNFVVNSIDDLIYYIDYECNIYASKWNFDNWGIKYWNGEEVIN